MRTLAAAVVLWAGCTSMRTAGAMIDQPRFTFDSKEVRQLFAPMEPHTFFARYFQKEHVHIKRNDSSHFAQLSIPNVEQFMASLGKRKDVYLSGFAQHEAEKLRTKNQEDSTPDEVSVVVLPETSIRCFSSNGVPFTFDLEQLQDGEVTAHLERGGTVLILLEEFYAQDVVKNAHPALHEFDSNLNKLFGFKTGSDAEYPNYLRTTSHVYATGGKKGDTSRALTPHTDKYDVVVAQLEGEKEWTLCTPNPKTLDAVFKKKESSSSAEGANAEGANADGTATGDDADENGVTEADKCELQLQEKFSNPNSESFYAEADMVAPAFECRTIRMQKGDTLYIPKGLVHYARSPEQSPVVSVHMTISQERHSGSWLDYVANALNVRAERLAPLVRNTQLGVELARLAPVNGARLLPLPPGGFVFGADIKPAAVDYAARAAAKVWPLVLADDRRMVEAAMSEALVEAFQMQDIPGAITTVRPKTDECDGVYSSSGDILQVHYSAAIDASSKAGTPGFVVSSSFTVDDDGGVDMRQFRYIIGDNHVLKGLEQGSYNMCVGEKRTLIVPPFLGYDDTTGGEKETRARLKGVPFNPDVQPEDVPKGVTLRIELEVVKIINVQYRMEEGNEDDDGIQQNSIFEKVDANNDYVLDKAEILSWFERVQHQGVPPSVWRMDKDGDGLVTWLEFEGPKGPPPKGKPREERED